MGERRHANRQLLRATGHPFSVLSPHKAANSPANVSPPHTHPSALTGKEATASLQDGPCSGPFSLLLLWLSREACLQLIRLGCVRLERYLQFSRKRVKNRPGGPAAGQVLGSGLAGLGQEAGSALGQRQHP